MAWRGGQIVRAPTPDGELHIAVVLYVGHAEGAERVRIARGTGNPHRELECLPVDLSDAAAETMCLTKPTYFYEDEIVWERPSRLEKREGRCPGDELYQLREMDPLWKGTRPEDL